MAEFAYNNAKHTSMWYTPFKFNCGYHLCISYEENINSRFRSKAADELTKELRNLIVSCKENLQHAPKLQKRAHNKETKPRNYAFGKKV